MSVLKNIGKSIKNMGTGISERAKTHSETTSLNNIINAHVTTGIATDCNMNEDSYQEFLRNITSQNTDIISDK